jgi:hypothetical protein
MFGRNFLKRVACLECCNERALFIRRPSSTNIVGELRAPLGPSRHLFQRRNAGQQCAKHLGLLQHCAGGKLLASERVDSLNESLKYFACAVYLHERTFRGD